ncbi:hypothetical protein D3C80_1802330 [compost metagenome]
MQATGLGHFDDRGTRRREPGPACLDTVAQWTGYKAVTPLACHRGENGIQRAFATIGHRALDQFRFGENLLQARLNRAGSLGSAHAVLE